MTARTNPDAAGQDPAPNVSSPSRRLLLGLMAAGLAAIFVASFMYRLEHPSLRVPGKAQQAAPMAAGNAMQAIRELMATVEREPGNTKALVALADSFVQIGALERAASLLERAATIEPGNVGILERLGFAYSETGKNDQAAEVYGRILAAEPGNALAHFNLGFIERYHLGREASALDHFRKAASLAKAGDPVGKAAQEELGKGPPKQ